LVVHGVDFPELVLEIRLGAFFAIPCLLELFDLSLQLVLEEDSSEREKDNKHNKKEGESGRTRGDRLARLWHEVDA
jgi:hypothetical protein